MIFFLSASKGLSLPNYFKIQTAAPDGTIIYPFKSLGSFYGHANHILVIDKGYFSEAFLFKPRGGRSPPSDLNRKPSKNHLSSL